MNNNPTNIPLRLNPKALPRKWSGLSKYRYTHAWDLIFTRGSRLKLKLLVFNDINSMMGFWGDLRVHNPVDRKTLGVCSPLTSEVITCRNGKVSSHIILVDPVYFAAIGLLKDRLGTEIITHESVHAAFAYAARSRRKWDNSDNPEEQICYPAGICAKRIVTALREAKLIE